MEGAGSRPLLMIQAMKYNLQLPNYLHTKYHIIQRLLVYILTSKKTGQYK